MLSRHAPPWVNDYIGTPFEEMDCWELVRCVVRDQLGVALPTFCYSLPPPGTVDERSEQIDALIRAEVKRHDVVMKPRVLDIVTFRASGWVCHMGIVVAEGVMLHSSRRLGQVSTERYRTRLWAPMIDEYIRIRSES